MVSKLNAGTSTVFLTSSILMLTWILTPVLTTANHVDEKMYQNLQREHTDRVKKYGEQDYRTLSTLAKIAETRALLNYDQIPELYQKSVDELEIVYSILTSKSGEGHRDTIDVGLQLADLYSLANQGDRAIDLYKKIGKLQKDLDHDLSLDQREIRSTYILARIAYAYTRQGKSDKALEILRPVYQLRHDVLGEHHPETVAILQYLGKAYMENGDPLEAVKVYQKFQKFYADQHGPNHPAAMEALILVAEAYFNASKFDKALQLFTNIHENFVKQYGREGEQTLIIRGNMANSMYLMGQWEKAQVLYRNVLDIRTRNLEPSDPWILDVIKKLIVLYETHKGLHSPELLSMYQLAHNFHKNRGAKLGLDLGLDLEGINVLEALGDVELSQNRRKEAFTHFKQAFDLRLQLNGHKVDLPAAATLNKMAVVSQRQFQIKRALKFYTQAYEARKVLLGPDDPVTLDSLEGMTVCTMNLERWDKAMDLYEKLYKGRLRVLGPDDDKTVATMMGLGHIYTSDHRWKEAEEIYRKIYESRKRTHDPDDLEIVTSIKMLGTVLVENGKQGEAIKLLKEALRIQKEFFGEKSEETEKTREIIKRVKAGIKRARVEL